MFIVPFFPKWFVHYLMTFCKNSIRVSCQIIFVNKHWPESWTSPFKLRLCITLLSVKINVALGEHISHIIGTKRVKGKIKEQKFAFKEKKKEIWPSPMTKPPIPTENSKTKGQHTQTPPKTSITQRLRTDLGRSVWVTSNPTGVVKPVYGIPTFPLTAKAVQSKGHTFKNIVNNPPYIDWGPTANQSGEVIKM